MHMYVYLQRLRSKGDNPSLKKHTGRKTLISYLAAALCLVIRNTCTSPYYFLNCIVWSLQKSLTNNCKQHNKC